MKKSFLNLAGIALVANVMAERPNIIYIFTDQQTASALSCAGNNELKTPNIDRLAKEGIRFNNAYCSSPLSTPSRASMFTGVVSSNTQMFVNGSELDKHIRPKTLGVLLKSNGYDCAYGGKWHVSKEFSNSDEWGFRVFNKADDKLLVKSSVDYLNEKHDKPFFMVASFTNPHNICEYARGEAMPNASIVHSKLSDCPQLPGNFGIPLLEPDAIRAEQKENSKLYPSMNFTDNDWRMYRDTYYRLVESVDKQIGEIISTLEKNNLMNNTIIIFSSDHGDGTGAHKWNQKSVLYEEVVNVPLIVRLPGAKNAGQVKSQLVNNGLDFFATVCDYSETKMPAERLGKSLRPILEQKDFKKDLHPFVVTETLFDRGTTYGWMVRTQKFKYIVYSKGVLREQLFDMHKDRAEMHNLAYENEFKSEIVKFRKELELWKKQNKTNYKEQ
jgi:arylsulfatase A-like enzyme